VNPYNSLITHDNKLFAGSQVTDRSGICHPAVLSRRRAQGSCLGPEAVERESTRLCVSDPDGVVMPTLLDSKLQSRHFVYPAESNAMHTAHGGDVLQWIERTGGMSAMHFSAGEVVTVGIDDGRFHDPMPEGSIALLDAYVYEAGDTSMHVRVRCFDEGYETGDRTLHAEAHVVSAAVDDDGNTRGVPALAVETDRGESLRDEATERFDA